MNKPEETKSTVENLNFEYFDLFCTNIFGVRDFFTLQEYTFAYFIKSRTNYSETLVELENLVTDFLRWQNVSKPEALFCFDGEFETEIVLNHSHDNDFTWNSCIKIAKENARRIFLFSPELPETKDDYEKRLMKEEYSSESSTILDSVFEKRNLDVRQKDV